MTAEELMRDIALWQSETFGAYQPIEGMVNHLVREAQELQANPTDPVEMADVFILLVGIAARARVDLVAEAVAKMEINRKRTWQVADNEGVIEHVHD